MQKIDLGSHTLRLDVQGDGTPVFALLHGLVDTLEIWDEVAPQLANFGRVVRFDQRGHGESSAPPGPYQRLDLARDAIAVLDALEIPRAVLVGHSMGGIVSMATALAFPDRVAGLVLVGTASRCNEKTAAWYGSIAVAGEREGNAGLARSIYGRKSSVQVHGDAAGIAALVAEVPTAIPSARANTSPSRSNLVCASSTQRPHSRSKFRPLWTRRSTRWSSRTRIAGKAMMRYARC